MISPAPWRKKGWWRPQLELALLGSFTMMACFNVWFMVHHWDDDQKRKRNQEELRWCSEQARKGSKLLA
jgi:hypothetical protein